MKTSVFHAFDYLIGLAVISFIWGILNLIVPVFKGISQPGDLTEYASMIWTAILVVYLLLGPFYFWNRMKEWNG
jgi:hypothetical protein